MLLNKEQDVDAFVDNGSISMFSKDFRQLAQLMVEHDEIRSNSTKIMTKINQNEMYSIERSTSVCQRTSEST
jgi:hypothetical protein